MFSVVYLIISIVILFILIGVSVYIKSKKEFNVGYSYLLYSCFCMIEWVACNAFTYTAMDDNAVVFWFCLRVIGLSTLPVTLFLFSAEFNKLGIEFNKSVIKLFFIIPVLTIILALTNAFHHIMYTHISVINENNFRYVLRESVNGIIYI